MRDEVHGNRIPWSVGKLKRMQGAMPLVTGRFVSLAVVTTAHEVLDFFGHARPVEVSAVYFSGLIHTHMAGHGAIMLAFHDQFLQRGISRDPDFALAVKHTVFVRNIHSDSAL